ncbi:MAG: flippase-like domain-containing protein [Thermomonas sp.]|uniref:lysylphosphatidylglycerol synthase domain-containing protein n=1 Tax=Thermomonas sp. TaxID=1971895 RepID=UPI00260283B4|nr:lysylphosphatidylglycerol synthase domain-containing protein [Thermomonas sp.]MCC7097777.1 flippase-like domain-containing protein [Thermomonas sp.]
MKRRQLLGIAIAIACTLAAVFLFDWHGIATALKDVRLGFLIGSGIGLLVMAALLRGLRWLVMLGLPLTWAGVAQSTLVNGAAAGLAVVTPLQIGEALKLRLTPEVGWRSGMSAFVVERGLDLSGVIGVLLGGLAAHAGYGWATPLLLLAPVASGQALILCSSKLHLLPQRLQPLLEISHQPRRILIASLLTVPLWLLSIWLWQCVAASIGIHLDMTSVSILLGCVVLSSVASMAPAGLGISELGTRGVMIWLGFSVADAEATAIGLRLFLGPMIVVFGIACFASMTTLRQRSSS